MSSTDNRWRRTMLYSVSAAVFGGLAWLLLVAVFIPREEKTHGWLLCIPVTVFWLVVGFFVGLFGRKKRLEGGPSSEVRRRRSWPVLGLAFLGQFIYRLIVGGLVGTITASLLYLLMIGLGLAYYGDLNHVPGPSARSPLAEIIIWSLFISPWGGFTGAVLGALVGPRPLFGSSDRVGGPAIVGSLMGMVLGAVYGALCGAIFHTVARTESDFLTKNGFLLGVTLMMGLLAGATGGLLAGVWSEVQRTGKFRKAAARRSITAATAGRGEDNQGSGGLDSRIKPAD